MKYSDGSDVEKYSWIIPPGWSLDGIVSTGSNVYSGKGTSITVTTDNTSGGSIQVAAENGICSGNSNSKPQTLSVDRFIPAFPITKGNTSNTFLQGDTHPIVLDAPYYSWATYSWTISGGGSLQQPTNLKSVTVLPNGCNCTVTCAITAGGKSLSSNFPLIFNAEYPNNPATVNGSDVICSGNYSFSLNYLPPQATTQWSVSSNLDKLSETNSTVIVKGKSGAVGNGTISMSYITSCGTTVTKSNTVWVGKPSIPVTTPNGTYEIGLGSQFSAWINSSPGASSSTGSWSSKWAVALNDDPTGSSCLFDAVSLGKGVIYVTTSNACGISPQKAIPVNVTSGGITYAISPNPATSFITVKQLTTEEVATRSAQATEDVTTLSTLTSENNIESSSVSTTGEEAFTVEIWHEKKGKVKTVKSNKKLETIDVSGLDKGNYFLHIITPTATYKEHILIE